MKIRLSELRQLIREEIVSAVNEASEDDAAYQKIMGMITGALGDSPETQKLGADLQGAMRSKSATVPATSSPTPTGQTLSMKSVASTTPKPVAKPGEETISMKSIM